MNRRKLIKLAILTGALILLVLVASGCQGFLRSSSTKGRSPGGGGTSGEDEKIKNAIQLNTISVTPNTVGFMTFYGEVTNGSDRRVGKVRIMVVSITTKKGEVKRAGVIGRTTVEDLSPGETKTFDITTSVESEDFSGYEVKVEKIDL